MFILVSTAVTYDKSIKAIKVKVPDSEEEFFLHPATVRRNDRSAQSVVCYNEINSSFSSYVIPWKPTFTMKTDSMMVHCH